MRRPKKSKRVVTAIAVALILAALGLAACMLGFHNNAAVDPDPANNYSEEAGSCFPEVDWDYWQSINPDIIGWITIPDTNINYPIMQAFDSDPDYYLKHDIYKHYNPWGVPFLDVECKDQGLLFSLNAVVYGHNMLDGSMFEHLVNYSNQAWAASHQRIYLQTPSHKVVYKVYAADVVRGTDRIKRCRFDDTADYQSWRDIRFEDSPMKLIDDATHVSRTLTLCTCSHNTWKNERTIVYASPAYDNHEG